MSSSNTQLSPSHARFVYWFSGLAPIATNIVTPLMVYARVRQQPITVVRRQEMVMQEVARQVVSGTIGILTYFGGGHFTKSMIELLTGKKNERINESTKQVAMLVGGTALSFIGYGFIRPLFSTDILLNWFGQKNGGTISKSALTQVGKLSGRKMGVLSMGFGSVLLVTDLLNRFVNRARQKQNSLPQTVNQPEQNQQGMQTFMGTVAAKSRFRGLA
jgi:hypothetical protein